MESWISYSIDQPCARCRLHNYSKRQCMNMHVTNNNVQHIETRARINYEEDSEDILRLFGQTKMTLCRTLGHRDQHTNTDKNTFNVQPITFKPPPKEPVIENWG